MLWNRTFERSKNCFVWSELKLFVQFAVFPFWCSIFAQIECFFFFLFGSIKWEDGQAQGQTEQDLFWNSFFCFHFTKLHLRWSLMGYALSLFYFRFFNCLKSMNVLEKGQSMNTEITTGSLDAVKQLLYQLFQHYPLLYLTCLRTEIGNNVSALRSMLIFCRGH